MPQLDALIQAAGVHDVLEARLCLDAGADLVGIPLRLPVNQEDLSEAEAAGISRALPGKICLITYLDTPAEIVSFTNELQVSWLQLHGDVDPAILPHVRTALPEVTVIKSLIVGRDPVDRLESLLEACSPFVDAFITDTYNPETGAEGATGLAHDWDVSRYLIKQSKRPVILAGGLNAENVAAAIRTTGARAVDAHTSLEDASGRKTADRVAAFVRAAHGAFSR
jgi:phosphoribosylanthranilate isomerase